MGRNNKTVQGVFTDIIGTPSKVGMCEKFLGTDHDLSITEDKTLKEFKKKYKILTDKIKTDMETLARYEEIIIQIRSREKIDSEIKLSLIRQYIYARSVFYRRGRDVKDVRAIIGLTTIYGKNVATLLKNKVFMEHAKKSLLDTMNKEIKENVDYIRRTSI
jgi:type IV secretory pathway VirB4 component